MKRIAFALVALGTSACIPQVIPPGSAPRPPMAPPAAPVEPERPLPQTPPAPVRPVSGEAIEYQTGPCFGRCPVYRFQVNPNGTGSFTGIRFTAVTGQRSFRVSPEQAATLAQSLAEGPTFAHAMTKKALHQEWNMGIDEAIEAEAQTQAICMQTEDFARAYRAFANRSTPAFTGE